MAIVVNVLELLTWVIFGAGIFQIGVFMLTVWICSKLSGVSYYDIIEKAYVISGQEALTDYWRERFSSNSVETNGWIDRIFGNKYIVAVLIFLNLIIWPINIVVMEYFYIIATLELSKAR